MHLRLISYSLVAVLLTVASATAQQIQQPSSYPQPAGQNVQPNQPVGPNQPTLVPRGGQPSQPPPAPPGFPLTAQQQAQVDQVLSLWERRNVNVKTFDTQFKRWIYDAVFGRPDQPQFVDLGAINYASPDKGMFRVNMTEKDGHEVPIDEARAEHWISDGKSITEFNHKKKVMTVHKLPPEMQGKAITEGPLPFLFGSTAEMLKRRYFIRVITPRDVQGQVWLEAYPRFQRDAASFHHAQFIITNKMEPFALQLIQPNRKDKVVYQFYKTVINDPIPPIFRGNPFRAVKPFGWQSIVEEPPAAQARRPANDGRR
jgi:TIGR03009 family protein